MEFFVIMLLCFRFQYYEFKNCLSFCFLLLLLLVACKHLSGLMLFVFLGLLLLVIVVSMLFGFFTVLFDDCLVCGIVLITCLNALLFVESFVATFVLIEIASCFLFILMVDNTWSNQLGVFIFNWLVSVLFVLLLSCSFCLFGVNELGLLMFAIKEYSMIEQFSFLCIIYFKVYLLPFGLWVLVFYYALVIELVVIVAVWVSCLFWLFFIDLLETVTYLHSVFNFMWFCIVILFSCLLAIWVSELIMLFIISSVVLQGFFVMTLVFFGMIDTVLVLYLSLYGAMTCFLMLLLALVDDLYRVLSIKVFCTWLITPIIFFILAFCLFCMLGCSFSVFIIIKLFLIYCIKYGFGSCFVILCIVFLAMLLYYVRVIRLCLFVTVLRMMNLVIFANVYVLRIFGLILIYSL